MKNKFTPGPWSYEKNKDYDMFSVYHGTKRITDDEEDTTVCGIWSLSREADARLIASAPDLLEALEELQETWMTESHYWGSKTNDKVEAAIKKARGL